MNIIQSSSPNFSNTKYPKIGIQIHKTLGLMPGTLEWLRNPISFSSCHVLFTKNGDVYELVAHDKRSWSAGRINKPSKRTLGLMLKNLWGGYVKPGHYLLQFEFECLEGESFTENQYQSVVQYLRENVKFPIIPELFWEHKDTAIDKPDLKIEREEILKRLNETVEVVESKKDKEIIKKEIINLVKQL